MDTGSTNKIYDCPKCGKRPTIWKMASKELTPDHLCDDCFDIHLREVRARRDKAMGQPHHGHGSDS